MSAPKLLGTNLLESATSVTATTLASGSTVARLYDRSRTPVCAASGAAQWDVKFDLGASPSAITDFSIHNHNLGVAGITFDSSPDDVTYTTRDTFTGTSGTDVFRTIATQTIRYWRLRVPVFASAPQIGEFFAGAAITLSVEPAHDPGPEDGIIGAVEEFESVGRLVRLVRLGDGRRTFGWTWNLLPGADWDNLVTWFATVGEGGKPFPLLDVDGTARWAQLVRPQLSGRRVHKLADATYLRSVTLEFREAL